MPLQLSYSRQKTAVILAMIGGITGFIINGLGAWFRIDWLLATGIILFFGTVIAFVVSYFGYSEKKIDQ
ncbi:MAG: hypothetical protein WAM27_10410 [Nitrososphaeraceae archaeon]